MAKGEKSGGKGMAVGKSKVIKSGSLKGGGKATKKA